MPHIKLYNQDGHVIGELKVRSAHFGVAVDPALVHDVVVAQQANARKSVAHTKTRGEVRGGGKKPWKQKGTGRARQGSIRAPQWVGGGITFGPRGTRNFSVKVNRKVKQKALFMALSSRVAEQQMIALEAFQPAEIKTRFAVQLIHKLPVQRRALCVLPTSNPLFLRMVRNVPHIKAVTVNSLNLVDVLAYPTIIFWKDAFAAFERLYDGRPAAVRGA